MAAASAVVDRLLRRLAAIGPDELPSAVGEDMIHVKKALSWWHVVLESTEKQLFEGVRGEYMEMSKALMSKENKMRKIKQIAYYIEDILDEFEGCGRSGSGGSSGRSEEVFCCSSGPSFLPSTMASRMKMVRKKLDRESGKSIIFQLLHHSKPDLVTSDGHGSSDLNSIIGRDNDKANVKKIINDAGPFSIIPIVGLSGIGKTALARFIFNDRGEDWKFDHHIWISLNMSFDLCYIVNDIISQAANKEEGPSQKNKWTLRNLLREVLTDKRSLVVLDDLWSMDTNQLDELKEMMSTVICSVIVTTSSEEVAKLFNTVSPYKLGLLSDSDCWTIFSGVASDDQETRDHVARLCQGMPIVAHSLSSLLHAKGKNVVKHANNKELWHLEKRLVPKVKMFQPLKKIYYRMPSGLKSCLGYLSIFPKGFHIDTEKLIWQWSALDMLGSNHGILSPYVQGKNYIQTLLSVFFLQAPEPCSIAMENKDSSADVFGYSSENVECSAEGSLDTTMEMQPHRQGKEETPTEEDPEDFNPRASSTSSSRIPEKQTQEHGQDISEYPTEQQSWNMSDFKDHNPYATSTLLDNFISVTSTSRFQDHNTISFPSHSQFPSSSFPAQIIDSSCTLSCNNGMSDSLNTTVEKQTHRQGEKENPAKQNLEDFNPRASSTVNILPEKQTQEQGQEISEYPSDEQHSRNISGLQDGNLNDSTTLDNLVEKGMPWWKPLLATQNAIRWKMQEYRSDFQETYHWAKNEKHLQLYTFSRIKVATRNFSDIFGFGGFATTYKGQLDGIEIVAKRYQISSKQHLVNVKKEIEVTTGLLHRNVLRPRGYCFRRKHKIICGCVEDNKEEIILIYDYMPNKNLYYFIFGGAGKQRLLDWPERRHIIYGIAQGLVYLHEYSEFTVIHLNIKPSNILLDHDMNPKICNFAIARILPSGVTEYEEGIVCGTYGYLAPEFLMSSICSVKSDVYSFGVTMLETISGKRCIGHEEHLSSSQACRLWMDGNWHGIIDPTICHTCEDTEIRRFIHVALLCIQNDPEDRPTMHDVTEMLRHESIFRPEPKQLLHQYEERSEGLLSDQSEEWSEGELTVVKLSGNSPPPT